MSYHTNQLHQLHQYPMNQMGQHHHEMEASHASGPMEGRRPPPDTPPNPFKDEYEEVVAHEPKNWKGMLISLVVIVTICGLISTAILILSPHLGSTDDRHKIKLNEVLDDIPKRQVNCTWVGDDTILYRDQDGTILLLDIVSDWKTVLASNFSLSRFDIEKYTLSPDHRYILLHHDVWSRNRFSSSGKYSMYETKNSFTSPLTLNTTSPPLLHPMPHIQYATWGPKGSQLLVVANNDIFYYPRWTNNNKGSLLHQLTFNGDNPFIYNGIPDLINQELVLKRDNAIWWLDNGDKLVFATYDNRQVDTLPVIVYGPVPEVEIIPEGPGDHDGENYYGSLSPNESYPKIHKFPYPKVGGKMCLTSLYVADLRSPPIIKQLYLPSELQNFYLIDVKWKTSTSIMSVWSRRSYNSTLIIECKEDGGWSCHRKLEDHLGQGKGWLSPDASSIFHEDYYFMKVPLVDGVNGSYDHISMMYADGDKKHFLTHGSLVVTRLLYYRSDLHTLYFEGTSPTDSRQRHIYSVMDMDAEVEKRRQMECLTCSFGPDCLFNLGSFSPNGTYYIVHCVGPGVGLTQLRLTADHTVMNQLNHLNLKQTEWRERKVMPKKKDIQVPLPGGLFAWIQLLLPDHLVETETTHHYPVIVQLDGTPEEQSVSYENHLNWADYLVSNRDYIVVRMDVRGSGFRGNKWKHKIYHHLGQYETQDIIHVTKWLTTNLGYVDADKVAIYGQGFGGYLSINLLSRSNHFNCAIAISPITSWKHYASAFVEKYMGLPIAQDNYINYDKSDLVSNLDTIKDKEMLLIHGTQDRMINVQHTMLLVKALTDREIPFKIQLYPDGEHSLYRERYHLHRVMEDFFATCFKHEDDQDQVSSDLPLNRVLKGGRKMLGSFHDSI